MHTHTAVSQPAEGESSLRKIKTDCSRYNAVFVREMIGLGNRLELLVTVVAESVHMDSRLCSKYIHT